MAIQEVLDMCEGYSGKRINREKSIISFSPNTPREVRDDFLKALSIKEEQDIGTYLGMPSKTQCSRKGEKHI